MDKGDYLNIAHENLIETLRYRANTVKNGKIYETDDFLLFSIGTETSDGHLNGCVPINHKAYIETFNEAESFFGDLGFDYSVWIRKGIDNDLENLLLENGFFLQRKPGSVIMKIEEKISNAPLPTGYYLKEVRDIKDIEDFSTVIGEAFKKDDAVLRAMFSSKETLVSDTVKSVLIYNEKEEPVSGAITYLSKNAAGLYFVGTLEKERGKGLGKAVVKASTNIGFNEGKDIVILQASPLGRIIYDKLNYEGIGWYKPYGRSNTKQNMSYTSSE